MGRRQQQRRVVPKKQVRQVTCTGKEPLNPRQAQQIAARMRKNGAVVKPYRCVFCQRWHVGAHLT
jgi:hypothetical protein